MEVFITIRLPDLAGARLYLGKQEMVVAGDSHSWLLAELNQLIAHIQAARDRLEREELL